MTRSLPGYRFLECLGRTALGESWKVQGPDGRHLAARFVLGFAGETSPDANLESAKRLKYIHHPNLVHIEEVHTEESRLILITQLAEASLRDRFEECRRDGEGIPRGELIHRLRSAAEALDYLAQKHFLHHLALNPRNLLLKNDELLVSDYALVPLIWLAAEQSIGQLNVRYAAPELLNEQPAPGSDQYSLALIYHEMLTGGLPQRGATARQLIASRFEEAPDLEALPIEDRAVVARALDRNPERRFGSCAEFIQALERAGAKLFAVDVPAAQQVEAGFVRDDQAPAPPAEVEQIVTELVAAAAQAAQVQVREFRGIRYHLYADGSMRHQCAAWLPEGVAHYKLKGFLQHWEARLVQRSDDFLVLHVGEPSSLWKRLTGKKGIEVQIRLNKGLLPSSKLTAVNVRIRALREDEHTDALMRKVGPLLLEHLHTHLLAAPEQRVQERFSFEQPLVICTEESGPEPQQGVICRGKDISFTGIGFYAPFQPVLGTLLYIHQMAPGVALPVNVARVEPTGDDWFEVGARFLLDRAVLRLEVPAVHE